MDAIRVSDNTRVNQVSSRTQLVRSDSNLIDFFIGDSRMKKIPLTQGKFAIVDDFNYEWLNQWRWQAQKGNETYYARGYIDGKMIYMHRLILGAKDGQFIDHKDHNGLDNSITNIRFCTVAENQHNKKSNKNSTSKYKGVSWNKQVKKWRATIKNITIGQYKSEKNAAIAYDIAANQLFGKFAYTNF